MAGAERERTRLPPALPLATLIGCELHAGGSEHPALRYGHASFATRGEDYFLVKPDCLRVPGDPSTVFFVFTVFDGHSRVPCSSPVMSNASEFIRGYLPRRRVRRARGGYGAPVGGARGCWRRVTADRCCLLQLLAHRASPPLLARGLRCISSSVRRARFLVTPVSVRRSKLFCVVRFTELYVCHICCSGSCICCYHFRNCYCEVDTWTNSNA